MTATLTSYTLIANRLEHWLTATARKPAVAADAKTYLQRIEQVRSIDDFLKDDRVYRFAMKAHGLEDMTYAKAFMRKVLQEGIDSSDAFANRLADRRYRDFAAAFNFKRYGATTTIFDRTRQGTVDKFVRLTLEETAGAQSESVRLALYFQRRAPALTSPYEILADKALTKVVYTALGLSSMTSALDVDTQARLIEKRIDLADFRQPEKLNRFIARFAAISDTTNAPANTGASLLGGSGGLGLGADLLLAVQSFRRGGSRT